MESKKPGLLRFIVSPAKDSGRNYSLHVFRELPIKNGVYRLRRVPLGDFHTTAGAKAYAAIHAGSQPYRFTYDTAVSR